MLSIYTFFRPNSLCAHLFGILMVALLINGYGFEVDFIMKLSVCRCKIQVICGQVLKVVL